MARAKKGAKKPAPKKTDKKSPAAKAAKPGPKPAPRAAAKKPAPRAAAKKPAPRAAANKPAPRAATNKPAPRETANKPAPKKPPKKLVSTISDIGRADPSLFAPLTLGERADVIRVLTEDKRMSEMAKVGRYRVISVEPLTLKPPQPLSGKRLARIVIYDYAGDRCIDACVDLESSVVCHLKQSGSQPMLSRDEEAVAISIAMVDERVSALLSLGDEPRVAMHYWSSKDTDLAFSRRSAAVIFGRPGARPSVVAVVDLVDNQVAEVVPASQW